MAVTKYAVTLLLLIISANTYAASSTTTTALTGKTSPIRQAPITSAVTDVSINNSPTVIIGGSGTTIIGPVSTTGSTVALTALFDSGGTVVNKIFSNEVLYGNVESTLLEQAIQDGRAFRARTEFILDAGETAFFYGKSSGATTETHFLVKVPSVMGETRYSVFLEPVVSGGTIISSGSMNPHVQAIGGYTSKYGPIRRDPTSVTSYGTELSDTVEWWGNGAKTGGSSSQNYHTILSVNQTLGFKFLSLVNANHIRAEWIWWEAPEGIKE